MVKNSSSRIVVDPLPNLSLLNELLNPNGICYRILLKKFETIKRKKSQSSPSFQRGGNIDLLKVVIDASFLLSFLFPDEENKSSKNLSDFNNYQCLSTHLIDFEVLNALQSSVRRKRISEKERKQIEILYFQIPLTKISLKPSDFYHISALGSKCQLSIYDTSYLYLAQREEAILASNDKHLAKEASKLKIALW